VTATEAAVVGAGPYGLSIAAHLQGKGTSLRIFGPVMETWLERMPKGMTLKSDGFASSLFDPAGRYSLKAYCAEQGLPYGASYPPVELDVFSSYGLWFQQRAVPQVETALVAKVERANGSFAVTLETGETLEARRVIVAAGVTHFAYLPDELRLLPPALLSHSSAHADPAALAGKDVVVLGGGASALDLAMLLHEAGAQVRLLARAPSVRFHAGGEKGPHPLTYLRRPKSALGPGWSTLGYSRFPNLYRHLPDDMRLRILKRALGPSAGWTVRPRLEGKIPFLLGRSIVAAEPESGRLRLRLRDREGGEEEIRTDHLIASTGYVADIDRLGFLAADIRRDLRRLGAAPVLDAGFQSSVPGLYFAGLAAAPTFGPVQRFVWGAKFAARRIAREFA